MLKKIFKVTGIVLGGLVALVLIAYLVIYTDMRLKMGEIWAVNPEPIHVSYDSASIELGRRLVGTRACNDCHAPDFGGKVLYEDPTLGRISSRNITSGKGGLPAGFSESDWVMALKHGLNREQKPLLFMPSNELSQMSEGDMAAIIAYMSTVPPVDREVPPMKLGPLAYVLGEFGVIPVIPAEITDHNLPFANPIKPGVTPEYGKYLAVICTNCHGADLKGRGPMVPGGSPVPDLTTTGKASKWTHEEFVNTLHTGVRPDGTKLNDEMPWKLTLTFTEEELTAIHVYAQSMK